MTPAQWAGLSLVLLGMALICGMLLRRAIPWLAAFYVPASLLAGFLILLAAPLGMKGIEARARDLDP